MDGQRESGAEEKQHRCARRWSRQWEEDVVGCSLHDRAITRVTGLKCRIILGYVYTCTCMYAVYIVDVGVIRLAHARCVLVSSSTHEV